MQIPNVTILGDSRTFDTYFTNDRYDVRYGYDSSFPQLWRKRALTDPTANYDVVHIPDHFRGGTVQNNIIRLALTDPSIVVVLDGIWESLLNKGHFLEFAERLLRGHASAFDGPINLSYSPDTLLQLFENGALSVSPQDFAERARVLVSYFRRRRRQVLWLPLPVPDQHYIGSTYHAGDYHPPVNWDQILSALNAASASVMAAYGCHTIDMTRVMTEFGGAEEAFIDQWHFSPGFHAHLAEILDRRCREILKECPGADHVSHEFMLACPDRDVPPSVSVYDGEAADEVSALAALGEEQILVYATELESIDNPRSNDREAFERQAIR